MVNIVRPLNWTPVIEAPDTTLWLPMGDRRPLEQIAAEGAVKVLGADASAAHLRLMERVIHDGTWDARERGCIRSGLLFWPDLTRFPPVANIDVLGYHPPDLVEALTLEHYRDVYGTSDEEIIGPIETTEVELPVGPALRFHRHWARKKRIGSSVVREDIIYASRPPRISESLILVVSWVEPQFARAMIKIADKIAESLGIEFMNAN